MQKPLPRDYGPTVRTPLDLLRHGPYAVGVVVMGIIPCIFAWGLFHGVLDLRNLFAVPFGLLLGLTVSWLLVYAEAVGLIEFDD